MCEERGRDCVVLWSQAKDTETRKLGKQGFPLEPGGGRATTNTLLLDWTN